MLIKLFRIILILLVIAILVQLYSLQQTGRLKPQLLGELINKKTLVDINKKEFNPTKIEEEINIFREKNNQNKLYQYDPLCELAKIRVEEIKTNWSHEGFEKRNQKIYTDYCNKGELICSSAGENLAKGYFENEKDLVKGWQDSEEHKRNMLGEYNVQCVAVSGDYYVSLFAYTQDLSKIKKQHEDLLNSKVKYNYELVMFWENQTKLNENYINNWESGFENKDYNTKDLEHLLTIFKDKLTISKKLWDGYTNKKITNKESIELENSYWELASKSTTLSKQLNQNAYKKCLEDTNNEEICKGYINN